METVDTKGCEFGYELLSVLPYAYDLYLKGNLKETISGSYTEDLYFFSKNHTEKYNERKWVNLEYPNYNIHSSNFNCTKFTPPPLNDKYKNDRFIYDKPIFVICNKYTKEWGRDPVNYFDYYFLERMFRLLKNDYHIIYNRALDEYCPKDENDNLIFNDYELCDKYGVSHIKDILSSNKDLNYNQLQLMIYANCERYITINGGHAYLASYFGGVNFTYQKHAEYGSEEFKRLHLYGGSKIIHSNNYNDLYNRLEYQVLLDKIERNENFAFARYGDGEFACVDGDDGQNCDGHKYYIELSEYLNKVVSNKCDYYLAAQTLLDNTKYTAKYNQNWWNADIFHIANTKEYLKDFIKILNNKDVIIVGNEQYSNFDYIKFKHILIPKTEVWEVRNNILKSLKSQKNKVILFSAGLTTNWLINELWAKNKSNTYIDIGSIFDPYCGNNTRSYHSSVKRWQLELISVNMATHPEREPYMKQAVYSLLMCNTKPDVINICLNNYKEIPEYLKHPLINAFIPEEDLKAKGKFIKWGGFKGFYLSVDDDIIYPKDYIGYLTHQIEVLKRKAVVGIHGTTYSGNVSSYWHDARKRFHFENGFGGAWCNMLGTGTMAFHTDTVPYFEFKQPNMLDPQMAVHLQRNRIPQKIIARHAGYLKQIYGSQDGYAIWKEALSNDSEQTKILQQVNMIIYES